MSSTRPLDGINVVSLEHAIAAPLCTRQLAELGANVIKIERRGNGDFARAYDDRVLGQCSHFVWTNRSKQSLTLDLKHPDADSILQKLLGKADVFVQNLAPGAAASMGMSFNALHGLYPQLIVCDISGYGASGPYKDKKAYDLLIQSEAGFLSVTGSPDQIAKSGISIADIAAGMQAHAAILAALLQRNQIGKGSHVDISMLEAMAEWMGFPLNYAYHGATPPARTGADHATIFPYGAFATGDDKVIMLGLQNEREWKDFCQTVLEQAELSANVRFQNNALRSANRDQLREIINANFAQLTLKQITARLDQAKIAYGQVNTMADVWQHPQLHALKRFTEIQIPGGTATTLLPPGNNSSFEPRLDAVPELGEHNQTILKSLGYNEGEIKELINRKVI